MNPRTGNPSGDCEGRHVPCPASLGPDQHRDGGRSRDLDAAVPAAG
ncbi:hypothetical protein [Sphingomonas sp. IBVSS2]|nr:hypothetical protein [Sphingomonas sp. IBVSS2]